MPLYDYQCQACGARVEVMHKMAESAPACPACGQDALKKQLSAPNFRLAGGGWYETDFKDKAKQDPRKLAGGSDSGSAGEGAGGGAGNGGGEAGSSAAGNDAKGTGGAKTDTASPAPAPAASAPAKPSATPASKPAGPAT